MSYDVPVVVSIYLLHRVHKLRGHVTQWRILKIDSIIAPSTKIATDS